MTQKTIHAIVEGKVQGVFFRAYTRDEAERLGLSGWVRNRPDGSVEALISGETRNVDRMLEWLATGSPMSHVSRIIVESSQQPSETKDFLIRY
jgi:acylphosphatase